MYQQHLLRLHFFRHFAALTLRWKSRRPSNSLAVAASDKFFRTKWVSVSKERGSAFQGRPQYFIRISGRITFSERKRDSFIGLGNISICGAGTWLILSFMFGWYNTNYNILHSFVFLTKWVKEVAWYSIQSLLDGENIINPAIFQTHCGCSVQSSSGLNLSLPLSLSPFSLISPQTAMFSISKCPQEEAEKLSADWNKVSFKDIILARFLGNVGTSIFYDRRKV